MLYHTRARAVSRAQAREDALRWAIFSIHPSASFPDLAIVWMTALSTSMLPRSLCAVEEHRVAQAERCSR